MIDETEIIEEKILDIDETVLAKRMVIVRDALEDFSLALRENLDDNLSDEKLIENENFKKWVIINLILKASDEDNENNDFNRFLYEIFDKSNKNIVKMLNFYDLNIVKNNGRFSFQLVILEENNDV